MFSTLHKIDSTVFLLLNNASNVSFYPYFFFYLSNIFNISNFAFYYFLLLLFFLFKFQQNKVNQRENFFLYYQNLVEIGLVYAFLGLSYAFLKFFINAQRPFCSLSSLDYISIANLADERCLSGFPSSHISLAFFVAYFLWPYTKNYLQKISLIALVILVGISRITLAMHFPSQLLISIFIAYVIIILSKRAARFLMPIVFIPIGILIYKILF